MTRALIAAPILLGVVTIALVTQHQCAAGSAPFSRHEGHGVPVAPAAGMRTPTVAAGASGVLWRVWVEEGHVLMSSSSDAGQTYGPAIRINRERAEIDANGEGRPKVALGPQGEIYVTYTRTGTRPFTGDVQFSRSIDGGRTFEAPRTINDDGLDTGHRFDALAVGPDGEVYVAWIDKRDLERATAEHEPYRGAALYYTISHDRGETFAPNRKIKDYSCECCRIAHAFDGRGRLVLFWRDVMEGSIRDHALTWIERDGRAAPVRRVTADNWTIEACPHHGPTLAVGSEGTMHVAWFTGDSPRGPGAFYGRLDRDGRMLGEPLRLGRAHPGTGHADIHADASHVTIVWKESRSPGTALMLMTSEDGGITFDAPRELAAGLDASDHPQMVPMPSGLYVSWYDGAQHRMIRTKVPGFSPSWPGTRRGAASGGT
jgi:hypothetical protein